MLSARRWQKTVAPDIAESHLSVKGMVAEHGDLSETHMVVLGEVFDDFLKASGKEARSQASMHARILFGGMFFSSSLGVVFSFLFLVCP